MRDAWPEETVARMLRAVDPEYVTALTTVIEEEVQRTRVGYRHQCLDCRRTYGHNSKCRVWRALELISPAETSVERLAACEESFRRAQERRRR